MIGSLTTKRKENGTTKVVYKSWFILSIYTSLSSVLFMLSILKWWQSVRKRRFSLQGDFKNVVFSLRQQIDKNPPKKEWKSSSTSSKLYNCKFAFTISKYMDNHTKEVRTQSSLQKFWFDQNEGTFKKCIFA